MKILFLITLLLLPFQSQAKLSLRPTKTQPKESPQESLRSTKERRLLQVFGVSATLTTLYLTRDTWKPLLDKEVILERTLSTLKQLKPVDAKEDWKALTIYSTGMALWELLGLSTIPVETAAAMVFGMKAAIYSIAGKLTGAMTAYLLGRYCLATWVRTKLQNNDIFALVNDETNSHPPILTAFLMKFSVFPEFIKNFGSSILTVITWKEFVTATLLHGGGFSLLWTAVGAHSKRALEDPSVTMSWGLRIALGLGFSVGIIGSPLAMAWWIRDLKR